MTGWIPSTNKTSRGNPTPMTALRTIHRLGCGFFCGTITMAKLTFERVNEALRYEPNTGHVHWKVNRRPCIKAGDLAGVAPNAAGYLVVGIYGEKEYQHRIAWLLHYGEWPDGEIDHVDGNPANNRITNLRDVSHKMNTHNARMRSDNTSGTCGVSWSKQNQRWVATWKEDGEPRWKFCDGKSAAIKHRAEIMRTLDGYTQRHGTKKADL